ncbi:MAG TPA: efflux RND transporter periplasmic adaptor subunit [Chiayiivirga sp.]|nr:efflux RND transporter periplasmic adaptor subunit [Chiayiivirga sp.]
MKAVMILILAMLPMLAAGQSLRLDGEIVAQRSQHFTPPSIDNVWNLNITEMAPDGSKVEVGDTVVVFDGGETQNSLITQRNQLSEKQSMRAQLLLQLAERERTEHLATEDRRAKLDKAQRKATQPENLLRRVDYKKLVIERGEAEALMTLAEQRETLAAEQRRQELRLVDAEIALMEKKIANLQKSMAALRVNATQAGIVIHRTDWSGEKFAVGSRVFRGQSVAEIPDMSTLGIRASVDERNLGKVSLGMRARVITEGGGATLEGKVIEIGRVVHSKSRVQPVPVVDLRIALNDSSDSLKPGRAVRVELFAPAHKDAAP